MHFTQSHQSLFRWGWLAVILAFLPIASVAQEATRAKEGSVKPVKPPVKPSFSYKDVIAPPIQAMGKPQVWYGIGGLNIRVSTTNDQVQQHVRQGYALLHASWDVEAYRHFVAALEYDPDCLLAYCGVVLSIIKPEHEWQVYRNRAFNRMLELAELKVQGKYIFPEVERGYAIAIGMMVTDGLEVGAKAFDELSERFPYDIQLELLSPFLSRGSYNIFGRASDDQKRSVKRVKALMKKYPNNPLVINFYIMMLIDAPYNALDPSKEVMPYVEKLIELSGGNVPTWQALRGFTALRVGDLMLARRSFDHAVGAYEEWMAEQEVGISDADGYLRALSFLAVVCHELKDEQGMQEAQTKLMQAKQARKTSAAYANYLWNTEFFMARHYLAERSVSRFKKALKALPKIDHSDKEPTAIQRGMVIACYKMFLKAGIDLMSGNKVKAEKRMREMQIFLNKLEEKQSKEFASTQQYFPYFLMSLKALKTHQREMMGWINEGGVGSYTFYTSAMDEQVRDMRLFAPVIFYPMEYQLARYLMQQGKQDGGMSTAEAAKEAVRRRPWHRASVDIEKATK